MIAPELWVYQHHPAPDVPLWREVSTEHRVRIDLTQFVLTERVNGWSRWGPSRAVTERGKAADSVASAQGP
jgi:hypothetical protein